MKDIIKQRSITALHKTWFYVKISVLCAVLYMAGIFHGQIHQPLPYSVIYDSDTHFERTYGIDGAGNDAQKALYELYEEELISW